MKKKESDYWDKLATLGPEASVIDPNDSKGYKNTYIKISRDKALLSGLDSQNEGGLILDFGCGSGNVSKLLSAQKFRVHGVDISTKLIDLAMKSCDPNLCTFTHYDGKNIPLIEESYNGVVIYVVLSYIIDRSELKSILSQIYSSMQKGAQFIVIEQTRRRKRLLDQGYKIQRTQLEYINIFKEVGFVVEKTEDIRSGHFPLLYLIRYGFISEKYFDRINKIEQKLLKYFRFPLFDYRETAFYLTKE